MTAMLKKVPADKKLLPVGEAVAILKTFNTTKFDQSVEIAIRLGVDTTQADQLVRGSIVLPHGLGKTLRVIVFAKGDKVDEAKAAGADEVGGPEMAEKIKGGWTEFDVCIAAPDMMGVVGPLGKVPRPPRTHALAAGRHRHPGRGQSHQGVQGGQDRVPHRQGRQRPGRGGQTELRRPQTRREHHRLHQPRRRPEARHGQRAIHQGNRHQRDDESERENSNMSKYVKNLVTEHLRGRLRDIHNALLVNMVGLDANTNTRLRAVLRGKNIQVLVVKNSLAARAAEGTPLAPLFAGLEGTAAVCWGSEDIVSLAKEITKLIKDDKYKPFEARGGVMDGERLTAAEVHAVSKWPSRTEQLAILLGQILSPGAMLASQLNSVAGALASQIEQKGEGAEGEAPPAPEAMASAPSAQRPRPKRRRLEKAPSRAGNGTALSLQRRCPAARGPARWRRLPNEDRRRAGGHDVRVGESLGQRGLGPARWRPR